MADKKPELGNPSELPLDGQPLAEPELSMTQDFGDGLPLQDFPTSGSPSLVQETADAVQELVLQSAADTVSLFPENSEASELVARNEMLEHLFGLVLSEQSFNDLVENILRGLMKAVGAQVGSVFEADHEKREFFFRSSVGGGDPEKLRAFRVPMNQGIVGHVAESRSSVLLQDTQGDEMKIHVIGTVTGFNSKSCIAAPIIVANQLYGVVELFNKIGVEYFDEKDLQTIEFGLRFAAKVLETRFFAAELLRQRDATNQNRG